MPVDLDSELYGFQVSGLLGKGSEGRVYKVCRDGCQYVLKVFHAPIDCPRTEASLQAYCERVRTKEAGFSPIELLHEEGSIVGLYYDYEPLFDVPSHWYRRTDLVSRRLLSPDRLAQALLSQYCFSQAYLLGRHSMAMQDGGQFLLGKDGQFKYIDYGSTVVSVDDDWCLTRGYIPFSLLRVLFEPSGLIPDPQTRQPGFDYGRPCAMVSTAQQEVLLTRSPWSRPIVERIRIENASVFLDPDFYAWIAGLYERVLPHPALLFGLGMLQRAKWAVASRATRSKKVT